MTVLVVTGAVLAVVMILGLVGDRTMDFYAAAVQTTARDRDRAAARATRARAREARRRPSRRPYRTRDLRFA
ncbi:hypothetical protein ACFYVR_11650 [Rhodococcus sp. NPDC003318]|uniref:hypothetical protein n=1 Tax=Rhodococcus sp. NPDC003318 TaxID=3364503 RepID=UPI00367FE323